MAEDCLNEQAMYYICIYILYNVKRLCGHAVPLLLSIYGIFESSKY